MKFIKILVVLLVAVGIVYYQLDRQLFFYGKSMLHTYDLLPLKIKPDYRPAFEGGFALRDNYGFTIAAKGNVYPLNEAKILIDSVVKYGFSSDQLVAIILDTSKNEYCVKFSQDLKDNTIGNVVISSDVKLYDNNLYKWVQIGGNDEHIWKLVQYQFCSVLVGLMTFVLLIYLLIKHRNLASA